jgi:hypothetical protein
MWRPRRNKYNARRVQYDGINFSSQKEADYYLSLLLAKKSNDLSYFLRQVPLHLHGGVKYVCDFVEFWKNGEIRYVDVKGMKTPIYKMKKKIVEATYPVKILEV